MIRRDSLPYLEFQGPKPRRLGIVLPKRMRLAVSSNVDLGPLVRSVAAPEIDPRTSGSALTLLLGALAVLRGSRRATAI